MLGAQIAVRVISYPYPLTVPEILTNCLAVEVLGTRPRLGSGRDSSRPRKPLVFSNLCYLLFTERLEQAKCGTKTKIKFWVSMKNRNPDLCISRTNCQLLHNCTTQLRSQGLHSSSLLPRGNPTVRYRELW